MTNNLFSLILSFIVILYSCSSKEKDIDKALKVYEKWREAQIASEKYYDKCPDKEEVTHEFLRYSLPRIEDRVDTGFTLIDTMVVELNDDKQYDIFMRISPEDCADGAGTFSQHEPMYLIIVSEKGNYKIDSSIVERLKKEITSFTKKNTRSWAERFYMDTIYRKESNLFVKGYFSVWVEGDASCCPNINMEYKALLPRKNIKGHIDLSGKVGQSDKDSKEFNHRIEIE